ncbi:hypothetical protein Lbir_1631, partial [Legionella birminghamensis]
AGVRWVDAAGVRWVDAAGVRWVDAAGSSVGRCRGSSGDHLRSDRPNPRGVDRGAHEGIQILKIMLRFLVNNRQGLNSLESQCHRRINTLFYTLFIL